MESKARIIVVGLNPGKSRVRKGSTLPRLFDWMSTLNVKFFSFINISDDKEWDFKFNSIKEKDLVVQAVQNYDIIVPLGGTVASYLKRMKVDESKMFKLPHPSPRNRLLNDPSYIINELERCREFINES